MELSRHAPAPARYTGIGIVIAVHVVAITALTLAFVKPEVKHQDPIRVVPLPKTQEPPPPTERPLVKKPTFSDVILPTIQPIPWTDAPTITPPPIARDGTPSIDGPVSTGTPPVTQPPLARTPPQVLTPGAVCSVMPTPEVPPVNWAGEAVLQVVATVQGGRVVGSEFRVTQGALDAKSRRALQRSVESALAGYQCQGDAKFQQDFAFRLE